MFFLLLDSSVLIGKKFSSAYHILIHSYNLMATFMWKIDMIPLECTLVSLVCKDPWHAIQMRANIPNYGPDNIFWQQCVIHYVHLY